MEGLDRLHFSRYGRAPDLIVRSPGRINLIGDHTDYCGLPVLPMAIGQAVSVAAGTAAAPGLSAVSTLDGRSWHTLSPEPAPPWGKYIRSIFTVLTEAAPTSRDYGAVLTVGSDLPATGGLSSSSALTVGCLLALDHIWHLDLGPTRLVDLAVEAERLVAVAGGRMDQTVITFARPRHAMRIDFDPPSIRHLTIPEGFVWVAGYSGSPAPKAESALASYNSFVLSARAAAALLGDTAGSPPQLSRVRHAAADEVAALPVVTAREAAEIIGGDPLGLEPDTTLDLAMAAGHVLAEAQRVDNAEAALSAGDSAGFGRLMAESHASLRAYGASTPRLDSLVAAARSAGALGSRVTGAGFGGWAVALTSHGAAEGVRAAMEEVCGGPTFFATADGGALWSLNRR